MSCVLGFLLEAITLQGSGVSIFPWLMAEQMCTGMALDGWLVGARRVESPNQDDRPAGAEIDLVVIHNISLPPGEFGGTWIDLLFTNALPSEAHPYFETIKGLRVSTHLLIRRDGELVQYVPFHKRAWHAGVSQWNGRERCNDYSIGIELEGSDDIPYTDAQYAALAKSIPILVRAYPKIVNHFVGHNDIAPGRKTDPGSAFDWSRVIGFRK
ncbi:N-acetyl-anhydromuramoyl-L-alanine amidase [Gammaproteobacteria bacterium]